MSQFSPEIESYIQSQLATGVFQSREHLLEEAIRLMRQREEDRQYIAREVNRGIEQAEQGSTADGEDVFLRLEAHAKSLVDEPSPE